MPLKTSSLKLRLLSCLVLCAQIAFGEGALVTTENNETEMRGFIEGISNKVEAAIEKKDLEGLYRAFISLYGPSDKPKDKELANFREFMETVNFIKIRFKKQGTYEGTTYIIIGLDYSFKDDLSGRGIDVFSPCLVYENGKVTESFDSFDGMVFWKKILTIKGSEGVAVYFLKHDGKGGKSWVLFKSLGKDEAKGIFEELTAFGPRKIGCAGACPLGIRLDFHKKGGAVPVYIGTDSCQQFNLDGEKSILSGTFRKGKMIQELLESFMNKTIDRSGIE
ncbi:MAG TPA: hypothetical protein DET40_15675 [Lentisphaeria bacterium]|nr:MAG: hypothetical protein A2X45_14200 [Lentisphaerae bacterium GWF2_50_93]HCE44979.1 hypothetical protein [Lentisphaeria bacterium]